MSGDPGRAGPVSHSLRLTSLSCLMFVMYAMTSDAVGIVIPRVVAEFGISLTAASALAYTPAAAVGLGALLFGSLADRFTRQRVIVLGLSLSCLGLLLFVLGRSVAMLVATLALVGFGISISRIGALTLVGDIAASTTRHTAMMNRIEGCYAIGALLGPALIALLLTNGLSWKGLYVCAACLGAVLILLATRTRFPLKRHHEQPVTLAHALHLLRDRQALWFAALIMLYVMVESAVVVWMPTFLGSGTDSLWLSAYALTAFFVLRAAGRFLGMLWMWRWPWRATLAVLGLLILLCFVGTLLGGREWGVWLLPLSGLFMSVMYPTINSIGISCAPAREQSAVAGFILFFTSVAAVLGPLTFGVVSDATGDIWYGYAVATAVATVFCAVLVWNWRSGRRQMSG